MKRHAHRGGQLGLRYARTDSCRIARDGDNPGKQEVVARLVLTATLLNKQRRLAKTMHRAIFEPDRGAQPIPVPREIRELYLDDKALSRAKGREGRLLTPAGSDADCEKCPCFYMMNEAGLVFFGGTLFFRLPYAQATGAVLPPQSEADLVDQLFGTARGSAGSGSGRKGRLRVRDLTLHPEFAGSPFVDDGSLPGGYVSPAPLLAPKPTSVQHYLVQPSADPNELRHYDDGFGTTAARGFKMYWHKRPAGGAEAVPRSSVEPWIQVPADKRSARTVIRPVREGVRLRTRIAFENLTSLELGALMTALELPPGCHHQIGMGRPLGFGSVRISVVDGGVRLFDPKRRYSSFAAENGALQAGWIRSDEARTKADECRRHFEEVLARHRASTPASEQGTSSDRFWSDPRMRMLRALLSWDSAPPLERTRSVGVEGTSGEQWKRRWVLPGPLEVLDVGGSGGTPTGDRPTPRADDRASRPEPEQQRWVAANVTLKRGVLTAVQQLRIASVEGEAAAALLATLRLADREVLERRKELRSVEVTVRRTEDGSFAIVAIASPGTNRRV